jgi:hypothetical protein
MDVDPESDNGEDAGAIEVDYDDFCVDNQADSDEESNSAPQSALSGKRRRKTANDDTRPSNLHPDDPAHFLKLSMALKLLVSREITDEQLEHAGQLLRCYCQDLVRVS